LRYWWVRYREAAEALWEKWRYLLDWPRPQSPILPAHHNFVAEGVLKYAEVDGHTPRIRYPSVSHGDEVLADHVSELVDEVRSLLDRVYDRLGPYISGLEPWNEIYKLYHHMRKPKKGDPIYATDYGNPMAAIWFLTQLFLSPTPEDRVGLREVAAAESPIADHVVLGEEVRIKTRTRQVIIAREDYWDLFKDQIDDFDVVAFDITASAASPSELATILNEKYLKVVILCDTQAYRGAMVQTFYDIFYITTYVTCPYDPGDFHIIDCAKQHFGLEVFPGLWDYPPGIGYKRRDVWTYGWGRRYLISTLGYRYRAKGHIIEAPYDGCWKSAEILDKFLSFTPCNATEPFPWSKVYWLGKTDTDTPWWHEYPTVVDTFKALVGPEKVIVLG